MLSIIYISDDNTLANETRIVLVGRTGSGKSATGNSILGYRKFKPCFSGSSITKKCQIGYTYRDGCDILVVDTPGMFDTNMTNEHVLQEVVKCVGLSAPGPHAFILVVAGRFTEEQENTVDLIIGKFGIEILEYMIVLFTRRDEMERSYESLTEYINESPISLQYLLKKCEYRCVAFDNFNSPYENNRQVNLLFHLIDHTVNRNRKPYYTNNIYEVTEVNIKKFIETERRKLREEEERERSELLDQTCKPFFYTIQRNHEEIKELQRQLAEMEIQRKLEHKKSQQEQTEQQMTFEQLLKHEEQKDKERNREQKLNTHLEELIEKRKLNLLRFDTVRDLEQKRIQKRKRQTKKHRPSNYKLRSEVRKKIENEDKTILTSLSNALSGAGKCALSGATVGLTVAGPIGAPIGAVIGGVVGFFKGLFD